ncbi:hypothetical protein [Falsirhodobacter sp. 20TX0035]|nr:hypothetical protein [Falsirhodobacter sp. 20TX0035]MDB6453376.1 hypothetical protein [Falsirhodobacter sp. 20TX0035]
MAGYPEHREDDERRPDPVGNVVTPITLDIIPERPDDIMPEEEPDQHKDS